MELRRDQQMRIGRAPAKLNLFLEVLGRRSDGFHELETLMVPIRLTDTLYFTPTTPGMSGEPGDLCLSIRSVDSATGETIPAGRANLVVRALELLRAHSGCTLGASVELIKRIPVAAGLGGGSSDAACALKLASRAWKLDWPVEKLAAVAAEVGSDVPFFLYGGLCACRGRGENVERLPSLERTDFVVVKPPIGLSTQAVFAAHDERAGGTGRRFGLDQIVRAFRAGRPAFRAAWAFNRLQAAAGAMSQWVERMARVFMGLDFQAHQLSGSGSAYFGICRSAAHARRMAAILQTKQLGQVFVTRSCP